MATTDNIISRLGQMIARGEEHKAGPVRAYLDIGTAKDAVLRLAQLEGALRVAYGQVQFNRGDRKRAWDGDYVRVVCEAALAGEPEPGDDWREKLRNSTVSATDVAVPGKQP